MNKSFRLFLALLLIGGIALSFSSCKDSENVSNDPNSPENIALSKESESAIALAKLLSYTSELDSLPDNWASNSYTVEPTVGTVLDESTPYVRYIATNDKEGAIDHYNSIVTEKITKDANSAKQNIENVGSLSFQVLDQPDVIATLDINIKQQPHLTQIRFVPASALGTNAGGTPYYSFGDIVSLNEGNGKISYWVCARPCSNGSSKKMSHWFSFQLNDLNTANSNFIESKKSGYLDYVLPTDLGTESKAAQHIPNLIKLLAKLNNVGAFEINNGLGELSQSEITNTTQSNLSYYWKKNKYFEKILPIQPYTFNKWLTDEKEVNIFYHGKSYKASTPHVWLAQIKVNGDNAPYSVDDFSCTSGIIGWKRTEEAGIDFRNYANDGAQNPQMEAVPDLPQHGLVIRYKSGNQLIGKSGNDKDKTKSFTAFSKNIQDVFVYKQKILEDGNTGIAVLGDYIVNEDHSHETCALSSTDNTDMYSLFFKFREPSSTEQYKLQPLEFAKYAYMNLLNALILKSEEYQEYSKSSYQGELDYQMPKFSRNYETGITRLYNGCGVLIQGKYNISEIANIVTFKAVTKEGYTASLRSLAYFVLTFPYEKNGQYAEADLKYDVKKQTYSIVEKAQTSLKDKSFFSLKSYKDSSLKLELKQGQTFMQLDEDIDERSKIKQATLTFIKEHQM